MTIDRSDIFTLVGLLAIVVGLAIVHPALLLVAVGYVALVNARRVV